MSPSTCPYLEAFSDAAGLPIHATPMAASIKIVITGDPGAARHPAHTVTGQFTDELQSLASE